MAGQSLHLATASATAECAIVRIEKNTMIRALRDDPTFSQMFMAFLLSRNVQIEADLVDQLFNSSEKRLARVLLMLANFGKDAKLETVIAPINQEILAAKVGTTRSRDQLLHEQVPQARLHRVQRHFEGPHVASQRDRSRLGPFAGCRAGASPNSIQPLYLRILSDALIAPSPFAVMVENPFASIAGKSNIAEIVVIP